jgi:arylsulfatase A-like enzyme
MSVDDMVRSVFTTLQKLHELNNTLAFFTSDNGFLWGEHGIGGKTLPYTESIRVPFLARWPGHIQSGRVNDGLVSNVDIAPTILQAAGLQPNPQFPMDGRSLLDDQSARKRLLTEYFNDPHFPKVPSWASIRTRRYQYTEYYDGTQAVFFEYYDLIRDPAELHNLIGVPDAKTEAAIERAAALLQQVGDCSGRSCP